MNFRSKASIAMLLNAAVTIALLAFLIHRTGGNRWGAALVGISMLVNGAILISNRRSVNSKPLPSPIPRDLQS